MKPSELSELIADVKEQVLYLQELGVESMVVRLPETGGSRIKVQGSTSHIQSPKPKIHSPAEGPTTKVQSRKSQSHISGSRLASLPSLSNRTLSTPLRSSGSGGTIDQAIENPTSEIQDRNVPPVPDVPAFHGEMVEPGESIESIRAEIGNCLRCPLHAERTQIVHSTGNFNADLMFVGEAPGADEDAQGFPFVGRAGQLLTKIIEGIGLKREDVFIGNINRCRPPGNRQPEPVETAACRPFLLREIAVVKPKVIVVLGATAAHNLLQTKTPISKLRGNFQEYLGVKVMPTFHPAYLLRDPHKKREVWEDMKIVRDYLAER